MDITHKKAVVLLLNLGILVGCQPSSPPNEKAEKELTEEELAISHCEKIFKERTQGTVTSVPVVKDWGSETEHYFTWRSGKSQPIETDTGTATGLCVIDKESGKGFLTLDGQNLGSFDIELTSSRR